MLRVKEMEDAKNIAEKELETIRDRMQQEMDAMKIRLAKELEDTRKYVVRTISIAYDSYLKIVWLCCRKLDVELDQKARLQVLEQEQHTELVKLRAQVKELGDAKALADQLVTELQKEKANAQSAKEALSAQTTQLQSARRRIKDLERDNRSMEAAFSDATKELEHLKSKSAEFDVVRDGEINALRKEFHIKHQESLAQWKKESEERIQSVEKEVRNYFDGVVQGYKNQVEELTSELDVTKKELERTTNDYDESLSLRESLSGKLAQVEREYREDRKKFKEDRKALEIHVEKLREAKAMKEQEFNDLMDVKIALDAEISAYRRILDREETRVGLPTVNKENISHNSKRKQPKFDDNKSQTVGKKMRTEASLPISTVHIARLDLEKDRVVLENVGDKSVSLGGWEVRGRQENQVFRFPESYVMAPNSKMTVFSNKRNKRAKEEVTPGEDAFLARKFSLNADGDFAVLFTKDGVAVSTRGDGLSPEELHALEQEVVEVNNAEQDGSTLERVRGVLLLIFCMFA